LAPEDITLYEIIDDDGGMLIIK